MFKLLKNKNGISLLALIMTIVIMLILATVTIGAINGGLFDYAKKGASKTEIATILEKLETKRIRKGDENSNGTLSEVLEEDYSKYDSIFRIENGKLIYLGDDPKTVEVLFELGQHEDAIENASAICALIGHDFKEANYLYPQTCKRCGYTEGEKLVATAPHPDQSSENTDIGIGMDGELANLDNWTYTKYTQGSYRLTGYVGPYSEQGEIEGVVPQRINNLVVNQMRETFRGATELKVMPEIPPTIEDTLSLFTNCINLEKLPENLTFENLKVPQSIFNGCKKIEKLPETALVSSMATHCNGMFSGCTNLKKLPENFTIPEGCIYLQGFVSGCTSLEKLPDNFTISSTVKNMQDMFRECTNLTELPANFSIPNGVTGMYCTFYQCTNLKKLPDNFTIPSSVTNLGLAFRFCTHLEGSITLLCNPTTYNAMFEGTGKLGSGVTVYYTSACTNIDAIRATATSGAKVTFVEIPTATE